MKRIVPHIMSILLIIVSSASPLLNVSSTLAKATAETGFQTVADTEGKEEVAVLDEAKKLMGTMMTIEAEAATDAERASENYTAPTYYPKVEQFLRTPSIWKANGAMDNCFNGSQNFTRYMTGISDFRKFTSYTNPSEILPGDVLQIKGHYLVCLDVTASGGRINLRTFETNWPNGSYTIGNGIYWVKDNKIHRNGTSQNRPFVQGWHVITSFYNAAKTCVDSKFYPNLYSDVKNAFGSDYSRLFSHWMQFGVEEGRTASPSYDVKVYSQQSDIKAAFGSNYRQVFYHYITFGIFEKNRKASHFFMGSYYLDKWQDLSNFYGSSPKAYINAAKHFNEFGAFNEHRQAIDSFSVEKYKNFYPDLSSVFKNDWLKYYIHYIQFGLKEGRTAK